MNTVVTIGRNVGDEPMSDEAWSAFKWATSAVVESYAGPIIFQGEGTGIWEDKGAEDAATVISIGSYAYDHLRDALATLAGWYQQEAIALTVGNVELVEPKA